VSLVAGVLLPRRNSPPKASAEARAGIRADALSVRLASPIVSSERPGQDGAAADEGDIASLSCGEGALPGTKTRALKP